MADQQAVALQGGDDVREDEGLAAVLLALVGAGLVSALLCSVLGDTVPPLLTGLLAGVGLLAWFRNLHRP